jgi:competence protein ComEC
VAAAVPWAAILLITVALARRRRGAVIAAVVASVVGVVAVLDGVGDAAVRSAVVPGGPIVGELVVASDPIPSGYGADSMRARFVAIEHDGSLVGWSGPPVIVRGTLGDLMVGERVRIAGEARGGPASYRGRPVAGLVIARRIERVAGAANPFVVVGNGIRRRVTSALAGEAEAPPGALLLGFLIGDVTRLPERDAEALRRSGLSHFVAVSGSNVALFLAAWWLAGAPLALGPRRRAVFGLLGLGVFVVVTRFEPSVVRAALMAGLVLGGRAAGLPMTPWLALGWAVALALLLDPGLVSSVGFSLSVAATGGIVAGAPVWSKRRPRAVWQVLGATISAQLAVAPLLVWWFGSVPLAAPAANLLAAPLVAVATVLAGVGSLLPVPGAIPIASMCASLVLWLAHATAGLPAVGGAGLVAVALGGAVAARSALAARLFAGSLVVVVGAGLGPGGIVPVPRVEFLDVGQGDAALVQGPVGEVILVDGGPDPLLLEHHLESRGVPKIDLLVISHRHADHTDGLEGVLGRYPIGVIWHPGDVGHGGSYDRFIHEAEASGVPVMVPEDGDIARVGAFEVVVRGPLRRYDSPNDMSLVIEVVAAGRSILFPGDVEVVAQRELGPVPATVLKVPHQGAATSDLEWLVAVQARIAVISVGRNRFGHPSEDVTAALEASGAVVRRTDRDGSVVVEFAPSGLVIR